MLRDVNDQAKCASGQGDDAHRYPNEKVPAST